MRNLKLLAHGCSNIVPNVANLEYTSLSADSESQTLYSVNNCGLLTAFSLSEQRVIFQQDIWKLQEEVQFTKNDRVVGVQHLQLDEAVCVAFSSGDLFTYFLETEAVECVGSFPIGIAAMSWSPDQELFALVTNAGDLLVMTREFDVLAEVVVETEDYGVAAPVNLGWGKRETQFQGQAGKLVNQPKVQTTEVPSDDLAPRVSWRGDGEYFVTSTHHDGVRRLRMWDRNGILQSSSEKVDALEQALAWRPSGNLIASSQRLPHRHDVVFFERNGLRHGEFTLPFGKDEVQVRELAWNCDSSILAVWVERLQSNVGSTTKQSYLQLWTCTNYHWYPKQEYLFGTSSTSSLSSFSWDVEQSCTLFATTANGEINTYFHVLATDVSGGLHSSNTTMAAVVDGSKILLTPLRKECVPPPMCANEVVLSDLVGARCCVRCVSFVPTNDETDKLFMSVVSSDDKLFLIRIKIDTLEPTLLASINLKTISPTSDSTWLMHRQVSWLTVDATSNTTSNNNDNDDAVVGANSYTCKLLDVANKRGEDVDTLIQFEVVCSTGGGDGGEAVAKVENVSSTILKEKILRVQATELSSSHIVAAVGLQSGTMLACLRQGSSKKSFGELLVPWPGYAASDSTSSKPCTDYAIVAMRKRHVEADVDTGMMDVSEGEESDDDDDNDDDDVDRNVETSDALVLVARSTAGQLYLNGRLLVSNCNSFAVHDKFIVFSTTEHACWFLSTDTTLDEAFDTFLKRSEKSQVGMVRMVERGSRVVAVVPRGVRVVLQMPRGNLETIFPRPLLLVALSAFLQAKAYRRAFVLSRKHRLNLNLLFDFDRDTFTENIEVFVNALDKVASINLFLSDLSDEDHANEFRLCGVEPQPKLVIVGKKDDMCNRIRAVLMKSETKYLLSIVHSYLCKTTPEYDLMLEYIRKVRSADESGGGSVADAALKYAGVIVKDSDLLYTAALGTYDFDLVVMVAQVLQKDPKEYLPFLEELASHAEQVKRYKIDLHLKRYSKALCNLATAGDAHFETCLELAVTHNLYIDALKVYKNGKPELYKRVQSAAAANLVKLGKFKEGGLLYHAGGAFEKAVEAFKSGNEWRWAISIATQTKMEEVKRHALCLSLAKSLQVAMRYSEAAYIAEHYLHDPELSIEFQIQSKSWEEALAALHRHNRLDLIETHLKEAVIIEANQTIQGFTGTADTDGLLTTFVSHTERLLIVRKEKYANKLAMLDEDFDDNPESDLYSDTSSRTSNRSRSSRSSSKGSRSSKGSSRTRMTHRSKRRNEAKKTSLRVGGAYEELALLYALNEIAVQVKKSEEDVPKLCAVLYYLGLNTKAAEVESCVTKIQDLIWDRYEDIWSLRALLSSTEGENGVPSVTPSVMQSGPQMTTNARVAQLAQATEDTNTRHPLEGLISVLKSIKIDDVDVDIPPPPPVKRVDRETKSWESLYLPNINL